MYPSEELSFNPPTSSPPQEAMHKSLKVREDEWRERDRGVQNFERKKRENE